MWTGHTGCGRTGGVHRRLPCAETQRQEPWLRLTDRIPEKAVRMSCPSPRSPAAFCWCSKAETFVSKNFPRNTRNQGGPPSPGLKVLWVTVPAPASIQLASLFIRSTHRAICDTMTSGRCFANRVSPLPIMWKQVIGQAAM